MPSSAGSRGTRLHSRDFTARHGPVDEVLAQIEPFWEVVDSLCPMTPYRNLTMDQLTTYNMGIYAMVAEARRRQATR